MIEAFMVFTGLLILVCLILNKLAAKEVNRRATVKYYGRYNK